jgi:surface antigen
MNTKVLSVLFLAGLAGCSTSGLRVPANSFVQPAAQEKPIGAALLDQMAGGLVGGTIGKELDKRDKRNALEAEYRALEYTPSGQPVTWRNQRAGRYGEVVAAQPYRVGSQDCRQYNHTIFVAGSPRSARGTACRNTDGSWTPLT